MPLEEMGRLFQATAQRALVEGLRCPAHRFAALVFLGRFSFPTLPKRGMRRIDASGYILRPYFGGAECLNARRFLRAQREISAHRHVTRLGIARMGIQEQTSSPGHADVGQATRRMRVLARRQIERMGRLDRARTLEV